MANFSRVLAIVSIIVLLRLLSYHSYQKIFYVFLYYHTVLGFLRGFADTRTRVSSQILWRNLFIFFIAMVCGMWLTLEYLHILFLAHFVWSEVFAENKSDHSSLLSLSFSCLYIAMLHDYPLFSQLPFFLFLSVTGMLIFYFWMKNNKEAALHQGLLLIFAGFLTIYAHDAFIEVSFYHVLFWFFYSLAKSFSKKNNALKNFSHTVILIFFFTLFDYFFLEFFLFSPLEKAYKVCALFHIVSSVFTSQLQPSPLNKLVFRSKNLA